jgi:copper chaperone CopZ
VREEVGGIPGVTGVDVDLKTGRVTIESDTHVTADAINAAVAEAGYQVAS